MTTLDLYTKGARVWIPHPQNVWQEARVVENFVKDILKVQLEDGEIREIVIKKDENLPPLRNPDILIGENDLTSLSYLHEPAVLHNLQVRFCRQNAIYTYCGIVLVAINPYKEMPIYGADTLWTYRGQTMGDLEPHIFAVAEEAYTKMEREQLDQSIIVSGESGAGKTVSAKYAMRYFAMVGGSTSETHVEKKVLASSPIMEAIGNAKTIRNDNSSRFGKYIELHCSKSYTIVGASMRTYLLEKSRVVNQAVGERNYHIFYQVCAAREKHNQLYLDIPDNFNYLNKDVRIAGVDDLAAYEETLGAMTTLGFSSSDCEDIFLILALILHLGNISIEDSEKQADTSCIRESDRHLKILSHIGQLDGSELSRTLCNRQITSLRETINKPMNTAEAQFSRDALAKHIYAQLFSWIVERINRGLKTANEAKHKFIGVLDIYGFETFEINSFEQFCINYANEKLQQQFNLHVFKLEQEEYLKEGIEWKFIDFYDNQPCIDLIESKLGILDLLDEECRMPKGSDSSWAIKLYEKCVKSAHFSKARFGTSSFIIKHFADLVDYDVEGFLEKNRDTVIEDQVEVLRKSSNRLIQKLFVSDSDDKLNVPKPKVRLSIAPSVKPVSLKNNKKTVGSQFRDSLNALMTSLNATTPHYIRCIKPNDDKAPFKFNPSRAVQQLRACGVLETIRISAAGFPSRWLYFDFMKRYRALCKSKDINRDNLELTCQKLLHSIVKQEDKYKFGKTKIFFRAGQVAYLERLRSDKLIACCIRIQTCVRGFLVRRRYTKTLKATNTLQRYVRGFLARRRAEGLRRNKAATVIQKYFRKYVKRVRFLQLRKAAIGIQTYGRGFLARKKYMEMRYNHAAILIQKNVRGWLCRRRFKKSLRMLVIAQSAVRRHLARREYKKLKIEARSVEHMKKLNKGLENKIISLQQRIEDIMKENSTMKHSLGELNDIKTRLDTLRGIDIKFKNANKELREKDFMVEQLNEEITNLKNSISQKEKHDQELIKETENIKKANMNYIEQVAKLEEELKKTKSGFEDEMKQKLIQEQAHLKEEFSLERVAHQKLLQEKDDLESRVESLEAQLARSGANNRWNHRRAPSDASTVSAEDIGYGSVAASNRDDASLALSAREDSSTPESHPVDVALVLRLQQKIKYMESDYQRLNNKLESRQAMYNSHLFHRGSAEADSIEDLKVQEMEMENAKLHDDLIALRECIARDSANMGNTTIDELVRQLEWRTGEVDRLKEENLQLRSAFSVKLKSAKALAESAYSSCKDIDTTVINEDGELVLAFEAQKKILRHLEDELQKKEMDWKDEREEILKELERMRCENEKLKGLLAADLPHVGQHSQGDAYLQFEVARITSDYLELQEKYNNKSKKCHQLQEQNSHLIRRLKEAGVIDPDSKNASLVVTDKMSPEKMPVVKKKDREYMGMFECKPEDINVLIRHLLDLKPPIAITMLPCLPAYILFMCVRYTDHINDVPSLQALILTYNKSVPKLLKKKPEDLDLSVLWLSNTSRLLQCLKQYSGEKRFDNDNTHSQNEHCLKNFDLSEFRQLISDQVLYTYQWTLNIFEAKIQPLAVPAILEHEVIPDLTGSRPRSASVSTALLSTKKILDELLGHLTAFYRMLNIHGVDMEIIVQLFRHIFYFLCAHSLNNLLLRREYCNWSKGLQIRCNLCHLEQWARDTKLQEGKIVEMLAPIVQASQLLQGRKTENDIDALVDMCKDLTYNQIIKLLNLFTPEEEYECKLMPQFIEKFSEKLKAQRESIEGSLLMDAKMLFPVELPFNPSNIRLEEIEIPQILNLPMLKRI